MEWHRVARIMLAGSVALGATLLLGLWVVEHFRRH
jgi:hypothetical protein